jgi:signal transduction histidine kinase
VRSLARVRRPVASGGVGGSEEQPYQPPSTGDRVIVRVVDRGPGIPPAQLERVFEPFYRAGTTAGGHRGSGLGLAIARGFTEANAGSLHVESLPGQGATFVFELPLQPTGDEQQGDGVSAKDGSADGREPIAPPAGRASAS